MLPHLLGASPLSFSPPFSSQLSSASPWEASSPSQPCPGPGWRPLPLSAEACLPSRHFPQVQAHRLSPSPSSSLIPAVNGDSSLAGPGGVPEWAEGRHPKGCQNRKIKISASTDCPLAFGSHSSLLQPSSESLGPLRQEV